MLKSFWSKELEKVNFINVGDPNSPLTVVIFAKDKTNFKSLPNTMERKLCYGPILLMSAKPGVIKCHCKQTVILQVHLRADRLAIRFTNIFSALIIIVLTSLQSKLSFNFNIVKSVLYTPVQLSIQNHLKPSQISHPPSLAKSIL